MKKLIIAITFALGVFGVRAENTGITTSQAYVETKAAEKQDVVPVNNANSVMTYDSTSADGIGKKAIYNATESYSNQKAALMTADTANAAIQNAINNEFTCANPPKCTLWNMAGIFQQDNPTPHAAGKNLLDPSFMDKSTYNITVDGFPLSKGRILPTENGKTYTLSATLTYKGSYYYYIRGILPDGTTFIVPNGEWMWHSNSGTPGTSYKTFTFTAENDANYVVFFAITSSLNYLTLSNYQMEEGSTATAYEPYKNLYIPQNVQ